MKDRRKETGFVAMALLLLLWGCGGKKASVPPAERETAPVTDEGIVLQRGDTLHVGTLFSPTSYFLYRDEAMGYDYELLKEYAESRGYVLDLKVEHNLPSLMAQLESDSISLIAFSVPQTADYNDDVDYCGPSVVDWQVLVQHKGDSLVTDVSQLPGREITVEEGSKFESRLHNLNEELGGGLVIKTLNQDTLNTDEMVRKAARGEMALTVVDSRTAALNARYYSNLDMTLKVSMEQRSSWAVKKGSEWLQKDVDDWWNSSKKKQVDQAYYKKYYEEALVPVSELQGSNEQGMVMGKGKLSPYDASFRQYASIPGWDWRLLAAVGWNESHFIPDIKSGAGARGIMQLMPKTAANFGLSADMITNPDANIQAGAKLIKLMDDDFRKRGITDPAERRKFVLAAYNSGQGHIYDAIALAKKYGRNPYVWQGNVRDCVMMKSKPQYYNDPVVKNGYFNGTQTVNFVDRVLSTYETYKKAAK